MTPSELRIGNWVRHYDEWSYRQPDIGPFLKYDFQWEDRDWYGVGESCMDIEKIQPVPITEEWLVKLNFEKETDQWRIDRYNNPHESHVIYDLKGSDQRSSVHFISSTYGGFSELNIVYKYNTDTIRDIQYIHQLQNLYFAINDKDL